MKLVVNLAFSAIVLCNCNKHISKKGALSSKITIDKKQKKGELDGAHASYNVGEDIIYVMSGKDKETFTFSFKKNNMLLDGNMKEFSANVFVAPAKGSSAIADSYFLDDTQPNKLKILLYENPNRRI